jgi:hypothetical protein
LEDTLRNIGLLRNMVVRAMPRAGSLPPPHQQVMGALLDSIILIAGLAIVLIAAQAYSFNNVTASAVEFIFGWIWFFYAAVIMVFWLLVNGSLSSARTFEAWWSASRATWLFVALVLAVAAAVSFPGKLDIWLSFYPEPSAWLAVALGGSLVIWLING